jgi:hypothetical protein
MIPSKRRRIFSWVVGIFTFVLLHFVFEKFASHFGLSTSFYFEGFERGDYVEEDKRTSLGWFLYFIEIIISLKIGMAVYRGNFGTGIDKNENLFLFVLAMGIGTYALVDTLIWEFFEQEIKRNIPDLIYNIFNLGLMVGIGSYGYFFYQKKMLLRRELDAKNVAEHTTEDKSHLSDNKSDLDTSTNLMQTFTLFEGFLSDRRNVKVTVTFDENKNFSVSDETYEMKRTISYQSADENTLRNLKIEIDKLIQSQRDVMNGLHEHYQSILKQDGKKSVEKNPKLPDLTTISFEKLQIIRIPQETKKEILLDTKSKWEDGSSGKKIWLTYFDNGQLIFDGYDYIFSDMGDSEYEFGMTIFKDDVSEFLGILEKVNDPSNVNEIVTLCKTSKIEPFLWTWSS